ncbi:MAG: hypothetical protein AABW51_03370 [Nanoarchaeota archaeon]
MKRWVVFGCSILLLLLILVSMRIAERGKPVGEAVSSNVAINISVVGPPELTIITPKNDTYFNNQSLLLNFTSRYASYIFYNIDNSANTTITSSTYFNVSSGSHTIYLYANNTYGLTAKNVSFFVNLSKFTVHYEEFSGLYKGNSTNLNISGYNEIQDLNGLVLEKTDYGKIHFDELINLTDDLNSSDSELDLDTNTNISFNRIEINSTALPNLNKSATLTLYNLIFTNPRILKDGAVCPASICSTQSYSNGILTFTVTQFSTYTTEETPASSQTGSVVSSSGGGGGSAQKASDNFTLDQEKITIKLKQGEVKTEEIIITNPGSQTIKVEIENLFTDFVVRGEDMVVLNPGESKTIPLYLLARVTTAPGLYLGKIIISTESMKKEILMAIDVSSKKALFDLKIEIPKAFLNVAPGGEIFANIQIFSLGKTGRVDTEVTYTIKDMDENIISREDESIAVETQTSFVKEIKIPSSAKLGNYILQAKANYDNETASSSTWFNVVSEEHMSWQNIMLVIVIIILIILIIFTLKKKR